MVLTPTENRWEIISDLVSLKLSSPTVMLRSPIHCGTVGLSAREAGEFKLELLLKLSLLFL